MSHCCQLSEGCSSHLVVQECEQSQTWLHAVDVSFRTAACRSNSLPIACLYCKPSDSGIAEIAFHKVTKSRITQLKKRVFSTYLWGNEGDQITHCFQVPEVALTSTDAKYLYIDLVTELHSPQADLPLRPVTPY